MRPDNECVGPDHEEYGGGGLEYRGLATAAAAMVLMEVNGRSVVLRSVFSRLMMDKMPLPNQKRQYSKQQVPAESWGGSEWKE